MEILGVKLDNISLSEAVERVDRYLAESGQHLVITANPEFLVESCSNEAFRQVLNSADLSTVDGAGIVYAARLLHGQKLPRVTGVDLVSALLSDGAERKIFLLGGAPGVAAAVAQKYPEAPIVGFDDGGRLKPGEWLLENNGAVLEKINASGANILLVAFGQVKQEMWINRNLASLPNVKVAIGIGGTFDYLSGKIGRAPALIRRLGLEWLYRLVQEPRRWRRIYNATIRFSWLAAKEKIKS